MAVLGRLNTNYLNVPQWMVSSQKMAIDINPYLRCESKLKKSCIAAKILKGLTFSIIVRLCFMKNLSNRLVLRIKFLITFSQNGLRILEKSSEVQIDGAPVISHEETTKVSDQPKPVSKSSNGNPVRIWIDIRISNGENSYFLL